MHYFKRTLRHLFHPLITHAKKAHLTASAGESKDISDLNACIHSSAGSWAGLRSSPSSRLLAFPPAAWRAGQVGGRKVKGCSPADASGAWPWWQTGAAGRAGSLVAPSVCPPAPSPLPAAPLKVSSARRLPASPWRRLSLQSAGTRHRPRAAAVHGGGLGGSTPPAWPGSSP